MAKKDISASNEKIIIENIGNLLSGLKTSMEVMKTVIVRVEILESKITDLEIDRHLLN